MDMTVIKTMLVGYLDEKIKSLEGLISKADYAEIKEIAHKIKGNSGSVALGLGTFNDIGKKLEQCALSQDLSGVKQSVEELKAEFAKMNKK